MEWLIMGRGEMIVSETNIENNEPINSESLPDILTLFDLIDQLDSNKGDSKKLVNRIKRMIASLYQYNSQSTERLLELTSLSDKLTKLLDLSQRL